MNAKPGLTRQELRRRNGTKRWLCWAPWWIRVIIQVAVIPIMLFVYLGHGLLEFLRDVMEVPQEIRRIRDLDQRIDDYLKNNHVGR